MTSVYQTQRSLEQDIRNKEIVGGAFGQRMTQIMGTPFTAAAAMKGAAGLIGAVPTALEFGSVLTSGILHQRYGQRANEFIAQQALLTNAGQAAMGFNPNATFLQRYGVGLEQQMMRDPNFERNLQLSHASQSWWSKAMATGAAGAAGGALFGFGLPGAAIGGLGGLAAGAIYGLATEKSLDQMRAEKQAELREKDKVFQNITSPAAQNFRKEMENLGIGQRMFGEESIHTSVAMLARQGISLDRATPILQEMFRYGYGPGLAAVGGGVKSIDETMRLYGVSKEAASQIIRYGAGTGRQMQTGLQGVMDLYATAGLGDVKSYSARSELDKQLAAMASERGPGVSMTDVGAGLANVVGAAAGAGRYGAVPATEQVAQGVRGFQTATGLLEKSGSLANTALISVLRQLGVTSAVAIDAFLDMGIARGDQKAIEAVARYTGKPSKSVREALSGIGGIWAGAVESVIGKENADYFKKTTGYDISTIKTQGMAGADYQALTGKGGTAEAMAALPGGVAGMGGTVQAGYETAQDALIKEQASLETQLNEEVKKLVSSAGDTVVQGLTKAVLDGFGLAAKAVKDAGAELAKTKDPGTPTTKTTGEPFKGVKK
jgi:hypothetical protein